MPSPLESLGPCKSLSDILGDNKKIKYMQNNIHNNTEIPQEYKLKKELILAGLSNENVVMKVGASIYKNDGRYEMSIPPYNGESKLCFTPATMLNTDWFDPIVRGRSWPFGIGDEIIVESREAVGVMVNVGKVQDAKKYGTLIFTDKLNGNLLLVPTNANVRLVNKSLKVGKTDDGMDLFEGDIFYSITKVGIIHILKRISVTGSYLQSPLYFNISERCIKDRKILKLKFIPLIRRLLLMIKFRKNNFN